MAVSQPSCACLAYVMYSWEGGRKEERNTVPTAEYEEHIQSKHKINNKETNMLLMVFGFFLFTSQCVQ